MLGRTPEGIDRWLLLDELQYWTETICSESGVPGQIQIEMGADDGGSWNEWDDENWIWWDELPSGVGAMVTDWGGNDEGWWRVEKADCVFNTSDLAGPINWQICTQATDDPNDIDIGTVWGHELMHVLGADHSDPCEVDNSIMAAYSRVCCNDAFGPLAWDQTYLGLLNEHLPIDIGEDENSLPSSPMYQGPLTCFSPNYYDGIGLNDSFLEIMDHDYYSFQLNYDPQIIPEFHVWVGAGENIHPMIKFRVAPESGPEVPRTGYAYYGAPGEVFIGLEGASGREWTIHVWEINHWGTEHGQYQLYVELYALTQEAPDAGPENAAKLFQAFDVQGRLLYEAAARDRHEFRYSAAFRETMARLSQGTILWRSASIENGRTISTGKFLYLKGGGR